MQLNALQSPLVIFSLAIARLLYQCICFFFIATINSNYYHGETLTTQWGVIFNLNVIFFHIRIQRNMSLRRKDTSFNVSISNSVIIFLFIISIVIHQIIRVRLRLFIINMFIMFKMKIYRPETLLCNSVCTIVFYGLVST